MTVNWLRISKQASLNAPTSEIEFPNKVHLDEYLRPFVEPQFPAPMVENLAATSGLDGINAPTDDIAGCSHLVIAKEYQDFENRRGYRFESNHLEKDEKSKGGSVPESTSAMSGATLKKTNTL